MVCRDLLGRQVAVVVKNRLLFRDLMIEAAGGRRMEEERFVVKVGHDVADDGEVHCERQEIVVSVVRQLLASLPQKRARYFDDLISREYENAIPRLPLNDRSTGETTERGEDQNPIPKEEAGQPK